MKIKYIGSKCAIDEFRLTIDKIYTVLGIKYTNEENIDFMIIDDSNVSIPMFYPTNCFEIIDFRISTYWKGHFDVYYPINIKQYPILITFKESSDNMFFWDDLINGKKKNIDTLLMYKSLMDNEFPDDNICKASIIAEDWVMCNECDAVWQVNSTQGVILCPLNFHRNNNPYWKGIAAIPNKI